MLSCKNLAVYRGGDCHDEAGATTGKPQSDDERTFKQARPGRLQVPHGKGENGPAEIPQTALSSGCPD